MLHYLNLSIFVNASYLNSSTAYIDPGSGISAIGAFLALLAGLGLSIFGFFWYAIKNILGINNKDQEPKADEDQGDD